MAEKGTADVSISKIFHISALPLIHLPIYWLVRLKTYSYVYGPLMFGELCGGSMSSFIFSIAIVEFTLFSFVSFYIF